MHSKPIPRNGIQQLMIFLRPCRKHVWHSFNRVICMRWLYSIKYFLNTPDCPLPHLARRFSAYAPFQIAPADPATFTQHSAPISSASRSRCLQVSIAFLRSCSSGATGLHHDQTSAMFNPCSRAQRAYSRTLCSESSAPTGSTTQPQPSARSSLAHSCGSCVPVTFGIPSLISSSFYQNAVS